MFKWFWAILSVGAPVHWIVQLVSLILIHRIVVYPVDCAIQLLKNWSRPRERNARSSELPPNLSDYIFSKNLLVIGTYFHLPTTAAAFCHCPPPFWFLHDWIQSCIEGLYSKDFNGWTDQQNFSDFYKLNTDSPLNMINTRLLEFLG